jgi:penicillin-binding protein 1A
MSFGGWTPANYERTYQGSVTVETALAESLNVPTAYLGSLLTPPTVIRTAHQMGVREDLPAYLPITIGAGEMTLLELAGAYSVFAAGGALRPPYAIEAVVDAQSHLIYQHPVVQQRLMSHAIAYLMTGALEGVLKYGTAESAARMGLNFEAAGKTGTTDDYRDAYFIGYTRQIVTGVWVGYDSPQSIGETGAQAALPAWVRFMSESVRQPRLGFGEPPPGITMVTVDPTTGGIATPSCPRVLSLPFLTGTEPTKICPLHGGMFANAPSGVTAAATAAANALGLGHGGSTPSGAYAPPATSPMGGGGATNNVIGAIGHFFGSLFGGGNHSSNSSGGGTSGGTSSGGGSTPD